MTWEAVITIRDWHSKQDITLDVGPTDKYMVLLYEWLSEHAATLEERDHYLKEPALLKEKNDAARGD